MGFKVEERFAENEIRLQGSIYYAKATRLGTDLSLLPASSELNFEKYLTPAADSPKNSSPIVVPERKLKLAHIKPLPTVDSESSQIELTPSAQSN